MLESKITITIRTIVYSPRYEREMKEEKKERVTSDTPTTSCVIYNRRGDSEK
jgi:hypothetical protein